MYSEPFTQNNYLYDPQNPHDYPNINKNVKTRKNFVNKYTNKNTNYKYPEIKKFKNVELKTPNDLTLPDNITPLGKSTEKLLDNSLRNAGKFNKKPKSNKIDLLDSDHYEVLRSSGVGIFFRERRSNSLKTQEMYEFNEPLYNQINNIVKQFIDNDRTIDISTFTVEFYKKVIIQCDRLSYNSTPDNRYFFIYRDNREYRNKWLELIENKMIENVLKKNIYLEYYLRMKIKRFISIEEKIKNIIESIKDNEKLNDHKKTKEDFDEFIEKELFKQIMSNDDYFRDCIRTIIEYYKNNNTLVDKVIEIIDKNKIEFENIWEIDKFISSRLKRRTFNNLRKSVTFNNRTHYNNKNTGTLKNQPSAS